MSIGNFFGQLKRRNVLRAAAFYAASAWLLVQVATQVFPFFHISEWVVRWIIAAAAVGFPFWILFAWFYEWTPQGLQRESEVAAAPSPAARQQRKNVDRWIIAILALAVVLLLADKFVLHKDAETAVPAAIPEKSIAVLPFENRSEDKANAYFADGIQDEILTRLSKIADLKVISRTSTQRYKSAPADLREIAKQLAVANVLEGSVQKAADQVRVSVQLINAVNDSHVWAETYDRKLIDVFQVESDVAQKIANALEAKLTGKEKAAISNRGTENPQAYDAYLRAIALRSSQSKEDELRAIEFCRQAVALDPNFAEAWAELAVKESSRYFFPERTEAQKERARIAAETAVRLAPELPDAQGAMGLYYYYCLQDYDQALARLERARANAPHDGKIIEAMALVTRRQGKLDEAIALQKQAAELDPLNIDVWKDLAFSYRGQRKLEQASAMLDRALAIAPNDPALLAYKAEVCVAGGDFDKAAELVRNVQHDWSNSGSWIVVNLLIYRKQYDEAIHQITALETQKSPPVLIAAQHERLGFVYLLKGDDVRAKQLWQQAEQELKTLREQGQGGLVLSFQLINTEAQLGDRDEFEREAGRLFQMYQKDKWSLPRAEEARARGYAILGDADRAIPLLDRLLQETGSYALTPALLRFDPVWDPIRNDPRFQKLATAKQ
jgi:TolB-like protein/Tfp pilus assembly protein PilF